MSDTLYALVDLECTCSEGNEIDRQNMETIEIACAIVNKNGEIIDELDIFIKPIDNSELTVFCTELTGITQEQVNNGVSLNEGIHKLNEFLNQHNVDAWCSWGYFDKNQLAREAERKGIYKSNAIFFVVPHINLSTKYVATNKLKRKVGLRKALSQNNMKFIGRPHNGMDDVRNTARLLPFINF